MANRVHLEKLQESVEVWNSWRYANPEITPDLSAAILSNMDLVGAELSKVDLRGANFWSADLTSAKLQKTRLNHASFTRADLTLADLTDAILDDAIMHRTRLFGTILHRAKLRNAQLQNADLTEAVLSEALLCGANLDKATLVETDLRKADLTGCLIYGISAWNLKLDEGTKQKNLVITTGSEPTITVDDIEVAQFIYLLLHYEKLRRVINTITSKVVLILGRFTPERKAVLEAMANELRNHNLLPVIFDFERSTTRDFTETIKTIASLSLFVIVDITNPKSAPLELQATIPDYQIPFVPIIQQGEKPFSMFQDLKKFPWVLHLLTYSSAEVLMSVFKKAIFDEAFKMHKKLLKDKAKKMTTRSAEDYLRDSI